MSLKKLQEELNEQKPKKKTTYKDIQAYIEEKYDFKVHTAYIAEVKRDLGLPSVKDILQLLQSRD